MRKFIVGMLVVSLLGMFVVAGQAQEKYVIYVVVHGGLADPPWELNKRGAEAAAALFPDLELHYTGPMKFDLTEFMGYVEAALAAHPDALVVTLTAPEAMDDILRPAIAAGLPVIAINAADPRPPEERIPVLTYVGLPDFYQVGVTSAEVFLKRTKPVRALYPNHHPGATHIDETGRGFIETMEKAGVPAEQLMVGPDPVKGAELILSYLQRYPETNVIFHPNSEHLEVLTRRLEEAGYEPGVDIFLGHPFDPTPAALDYLEQGKWVFCNDQQMYLQGFYGVLFAYMKAKYGFEPPPPPVRTGPVIITKEDVPKLRELMEKGYR